MGRESSVLCPARRSADGSLWAGFGVIDCTFRDVIKSTLLRIDIIARM